MIQRLLLLLLAVAASALAAPPEATLLRTSREGPVDLRGYGRVGMEGSLWQTAAGQVALVTFTCQDERTAGIVASKYLADLLGYGATATAEPLPGIGGTIVQVRHAGYWLLAVDGAAARILSAPDRESLRQAAEVLRGNAWQPVAAGAHPRWLDNFDNGIGIWWMATSKTEEQLEWMKAHPSVVNLHDVRLSSEPAPGVIDLSPTDNSLSQIHGMGKAYRHMLWAGGQPPWFNSAHMPGHHGEKYPDGFIGRRFFESSGYNHEQVASPEVHTVVQAAMIRMMRERVNDPDLLAWMEPHGEFFKSDPAMLPPGYQQRFPAYLQLEKKYSLATISTAYTGNRHAYSDWSDVPYPSTAWFAGRRGSFIDLDDIPWRWEPRSLAEGEEAGYHLETTDDSGWRENYRDDHVMLSQWDNSRIHPLWIRFSHDLPADLLQTGKRIWLHLMPYTEHVGGELTIWVNGSEICRQKRDITDHIERHAQIEVTDILHAGSNDFVIYSNGGRIAYRVFLSDTEGESFPFSDPHLNQRYLDWQDYLSWEKQQTLITFLKTMRSVDPNRPIKVMTPFLFQSDAMVLFQRYGGYPQLTGEGGWYRPMHYKGYSRLYGIPGSSEPGGAMTNPRDTQNMFANIFWESQDCHDYVFDLNRELWRYPKVVEWWTQNASLLATLGKIDFAEARVGLLRSVRQNMRYANSQIWNWDLSRGPLPSIGLTPVLVDGPAMEEGRADHLPVLLDCATIVMDDAMVDAIYRYVAGGGTYIAQHHTGQHTPMERDVWPLHRRFGLKVANRYLNDENPHKWPTAPIRFTEEQSLFPSLRGKSCEGSGVAIDYLDNAYTGAIAIESAAGNVTPIATWEDGSMAIAEIRVGRGRLILVGTPFFLRFKDENGRWFNDAEKQALFVSLLEGVGLTRDTHTSEERIWFERRESKNGLYEVYLASAVGIRDKSWTLEDRIVANLAIDRFAPAPAVEPNAPDSPDVATSHADGRLSLGEQTFSPYQVRQFAILRDNVGLEAPRHWLAVQQRAWRALEPIPPSRADDILAEAAALADSLGEAGIGLFSGWQVQIDPTSDEQAWLDGDTEGAITADLGSWRARGWPDASLVRYRQRVDIPTDWRSGSRVILGMENYWQFGIRDKARLWINGEHVADCPHGTLAFDVTTAAATGSLDIALAVEGKGVDRGPIGTLYLRRLPAPIAILELDGEWSRIIDWGRNEGTLALPYKGKLFGIERNVDIPAEWADHPVRLVIEKRFGSYERQMSGTIINRTGFFRTEDWEPLGQRIDRWLQPGATNLLQLYGFNFMSIPYLGNDVDLQSIRLEIYPPIAGN